jgi:hypothetical protein
MQCDLPCGEVFVEGVCLLEKLLKMSLAGKNSIHGGIVEHLKIMQFTISLGQHIIQIIKQ